MVWRVGVINTAFCLPYCGYDRNSGEMFDNGQNYTPSHVEIELAQEQTHVCCN